MRHVLTTVLILLSVFSYSQDFTNLSIHSNLDNVKGLEIKPVFTDWYMSYFLSENKGSRIDWGGGIGYYRENNLFDYSAGFKIGISKLNGISAPIYGLEVDLLHNASDVFFIGVKTNYNRVNYRDEKTNIIHEFNLTIKIGLKI